jgi:phospholipase/carboxylesterase
MNRIATSPLLGPALSSHSDLLSKSPANPGHAGTATQTRRNLGHALFTPLHYEPNYAYPLIVWLHGAGGTEQQLRKVMPLVSLRNYVGVAPRGTLVMDDEDAATSSYCWSQSEDQIALAAHRVMDAVDAAREKFNIARRRIFLAGMDCGGTMAFRLALRHPDWFTGVLSLGGEFPQGNMPFMRLTEARRLPVFVACGRESKTYPQAQVCDNLRLWHSAGLSVTLRQYPCGDEITADMFGDMDRWIMEQILPPEPKCEDPSQRLDSAN